MITTPGKTSGTSYQALGTGSRIICRKGLLADGVAAPRKAPGAGERLNPRDLVSSYISSLLVRGR